MPLEQDLPRAFQATVIEPGDGFEAGPFRVTAAITRDAVEELGLVEGAHAVATVKATSVMIERGRG